MNGQVIMFLLFSLLYRVTQKIGAIHYLPQLEGTKFAEFITQNNYTVIFFTDDTDNFTQANYAINKFTRSKQIQFAIATQKEASLMGIRDFPVVSSFAFGKLNQTLRSISSSLDFAYWCKSLVPSPRSIIFNAEDLRIQFETHQATLFGIEQRDPPKDYKNEVPFIRAPSSIFRQFNLTVVPGYYVYRPSDRQLLKVSGSFKKYLKSPVVDLETTNISTRPFLAGYVIDPLNATIANQEITILNDLAVQFPEKAFFSPIAGQIQTLFNHVSQLTYLRKPLFVVWKTNELNNSRWILNDETKIHNKEYLKNYIQSIISGNEPKVPIVEPKNMSDPYQIVYSEFEKYTTQKTVVLMSNIFPPKYMLLFKRAAEIYKDTDIQFCTYDLAYNDVPENFLIANTPPLLLMINQSKQSVYRYNGPLFIKDIAQFISDESNTTLPQFDHVSIQKSIERELAPKPKPGAPPSFEDVFGYD